MTASFEHADEVRMALRSVVSDSAFDPDSLSNPQVAANLLSDLLPDAPRETSLLLAAISAGVPAMLRENIAQGMDGGTAISLTAATLADRTAFSLEACEWVVTELAIALDAALAMRTPPHTATEVRTDAPALSAGKPIIGIGGLGVRAEDRTTPDAGTATWSAAPRERRRVRPAIVSTLGVVAAAAVGAGFYVAGLPGTTAQHRHPPSPGHSGKTTRLVSGPLENGWIAQLAYVSLRAGNARRDSALARVRLDVPQAQYLNASVYASLRPGYWVIYYAGPFTNGTQALAYCASHGRATRALCIGRYLSNNPADFRYQCYPPASNPSGNCTRGVASPVHVVEAYFAAINRRNWPRVWALGGKNLGESYDQLVAGFAHTRHVLITTITASGRTVTVITNATETNGVTQRYRFSYLVSNGIITAGRSELINSSTG